MSFNVVDIVGAGVVAVCVAAGGSDIVDVEDILIGDIA